MILNEPEMDKNALLSGSCGLSRWILKSPTIITLFEIATRLDTKSASSCKNSEKDPGGL